MFPISPQSIISNKMKPRRLRGAWFSCLLRHPARIRCGSIQSPETHTGIFRTYSLTYITILYLHIYLHTYFFTFLLHILPTCLLIYLLLIFCLHSYFCLLTYLLTYILILYLHNYLHVYFYIHAYLFTYVFLLRYDNRYTLDKFKPSVVEHKRKSLTRVRTSCLA